MISSPAMQALLVRQWGDLSEVHPGEAPRPDPAPGACLLRMAYSGVNFMDVYTVRGAYKDSRTYPLRLPLTLGMEGCGVVAAAGDGADGFRVGERVSFCLQWARTPSGRPFPPPSSRACRMVSARIGRRRSPSKESRRTTWPSDREAVRFGHLR